MRKRILLAVALALLCPALGARAAAILVNEYNGVAAAQYLNGGTAAADADGGAAADPYFGRVLGNGGDWLELVVIQDHLDLRGNSLSIAEGIGAGRTTTVLNFTQSSLWSDLRSGTIITVAEDVPDDPSYAPLAGDWWINVQASNTASGLFITASNFSVSNDDTQITVLDALSAVLFGPAGEGVQPLERDQQPRGLEARGRSVGRDHADLELPGRHLVDIRRAEPLEQRRQRAGLLDAARGGAGARERDAASVSPCSV